MNVILSRKGFDSKYGGRPSPILPDGRLLSLPIPVADGNIRYRDLTFENRTYLDLVNELGSGFESTATCHLDPDIYRSVLARPASWRPLFGQAGIAQRHLDRQGISEGDLFLFFGWFRQTVAEGGRLVFERRAPHVHALFGYLQVGRKITVAEGAAEGWMRYHPHFRGAHRGSKDNTVYEAALNLSWDRSVPGAGALLYHPVRILTKEGCSRSVWQLPDFLRQTTITYHSRRSWSAAGFQSACIGQEFVIAPCDGLEAWVREIIAASH